MSVDDLFSSLEKQCKCVIKYRDKMHNEEHTKMGFILPFFKVLGYNMLAPDEVIAEYSCDFGTKKGEKVDFAIMKDGDPIILIEAKHCDKVLDERFASQLSRYFNQTDVKLGILTNGIQYWFYSDFEKLNVMDAKPFYRFDILHFTREDVEKLYNFTREVFFSNDDVLSKWGMIGIDVKYNDWVQEQLCLPSDEFLELFCKDLSIKCNPGELREIIFNSQNTSSSASDTTSNADAITSNANVITSSDADTTEFDFEDDDTDSTHQRINVQERLTSKGTSEARNRSKLVTIKSTDVSVYSDFRMKYLRDNSVSLAKKCDHSYNSQIDASYLVNYRDITFDFLCAKDACSTNVFYQSIFGVMIGDTIYQTYTWSAILAAVIEYLFSLGYTVDDILASESREKRVLWGMDESTSFASGAEYKGIQYANRLNAPQSVKTFVYLLSSYNIDLSSVYIILYTTQYKGVPQKLQSLDSVGRIIGAKVIDFK